MRGRNVEHFSGCIESYLKSFGLELLDQLAGEPEVTPCFQQPEGDVFCRPHSMGESSPEETASLDELKKGVGYLQDKSVWINSRRGCTITSGIGER